MEEMLTFMDANPVIEGKRLILRRMQKSDAYDMYCYARDPEVSRYLLWSPHLSPEYTRRYLDEVMRQYRIHSFFDFAVVYKENGKMIGTCGFTRIDPYNHLAEIGYVLAQPYWHKGLASEAVALILRYAFCHLGFQRVEARYMVENPRSRSVMERNGMVFEGVAGKSVYAKGQYHDVGICAILRENYPANEALTFSLTESKPKRSLFPFG